MPSVDTASNESHSPSPGPEGRRRPAGSTGAEEVGDRSDLLTGGAILAVGRGGEILAHRSPLPLPVATAGSVAGLRLHQLEPGTLGRGLQRLLEEVRDGGDACTAELTIASALPDQAETAMLSLRIVPHPERNRVFQISVRNITAYGERLQHLCHALDALRAERDEWEAVARSVAHDVRSSLAALTGFMNLALLEPTSQGQGAREHVSRALEIGNRLVTLTDLLVENPRRRPAEAEFLDVGTFGARLLTALQVAHPQVGFAWCVDAAGVGVRTSPAALWNLLWGLTSNAIKYRSASRQLQIDLRARACNEQVEIAVQDNGIGIPPGEEAAVFQPGWRGSNAKGVEGSGLGLHGVRLLAQKCQGRVWAEPCPTGASFRVVLPSLRPAG